MKHEIITQNKIEAEIRIELDEKQLSTIKKEIITRLKPSLKVDGFRPGKMPDAIAERHLDTTKLQMEVVDAALSRSWRETVEQTKLDILSSPKVEITKFVPFTQLEYTAKIALVPKLDFDYGTLKVKAEPFKVDEAEIDKTIVSLQNQMAKRTKASRAAKIGDELKFDFVGSRKGKPVEGAAAKGHILRLGEGQFIPGFEDNLVGLKSGDNKQFNVTFPKDYGKADLAGQVVDFDVNVIAVTAIDLPEVNDNFAREIGQFDSVKKLRDDIAARLSEAGQQQAQKEYEDKVITELLTKIKLDVSPLLTEEQIHSLTHNVEDQLKSSGLSWEQYAAMSGKKEADIRAEIEAEATKRVKLGLVIRDIITKQKFTVEDIEVNDEIEKMRSSYTDPKMLEEFDHDHFKSDVASYLLSRKALDWLTAQVKGGK